MTVRCPVCAVVLETEEDLAAHEHELDERLAGGQGFQCPMCGEAFWQEDALVRHQATDHVGVDQPGPASGEL